MWVSLHAYTFRIDPTFSMFSFAVCVSALLEHSFHSGSSQIHLAGLLLVLSVSSLAFMGGSPKLPQDVLALTGHWLYRGLGVIPIFLSEISPPAFRSTFPGVGYQLGNMVSSASAQIEAS